MRVAFSLLTSEKLPGSNLSESDSWSLISFSIDKKINQWYKETMLLLSPKNIVAMGIIAFLVMSIWSLSAMSMDTNGHMAGCPLMNGSTGFCQMTLTEHMRPLAANLFSDKNNRFIFVVVVVDFSFFCFICCDRKNLLPINISAVSSLFL